MFEGRFGVSGLLGRGSFLTELGDPYGTGRINLGLPVLSPLECSLWFQHLLFGNA